MRIHSLLRITTVAMTVTFATLLTLFISRYAQLQQQYIITRFNHSTQLQAEKFNTEIESASRDLMKVQGYVKILDAEALSREDRFRRFKDLMARTIRFDPNEYNCYAAFEPEMAQQYWGTDGLSYDLSKRYNLIGTGSFNDPETFELSPDTRPFYQQDQSQVWYHYAKRSTRVEITPIYFDSEYTRQWLVTLSLGIYEYGKFQGMVGMDLLLDNLFSSVELAQVGETGGQLIAHAESGLVLTQVGRPGSKKLEFVSITSRQQATLFSAASDVPWETWRQVLQDNLSHVTVTGNQNRTYVVSSQRLKRLPWTVITYQQQDELRAPLHQGILLYGMMGGVVLLAMAALSYAVNRKVTDPILHLTAAMKTVIQNHVSELVAPVQGSLETRQLGHYFNEMLRSISEASRAKDEFASKLAESNRKLEEFNADLEKRIAERTEELKIAKDIAEEANRAKSAFLANMSHELRTPLNAILGYAEMLKEDAKENGMEPMVDDVEKIHAAGLHLLELINAVLDLSKIEAGKMELYLERFDVPQMVQDVLAIVQPLARRHNNQLSVDCPADIGLMYADMVKVRQTVINLLSNAFKFTRGGMIRLAVSKQPKDGQEGIGFAVSDTGIGMTLEQTARLFQAFSQADTSTSRKYGGTGLGLVISRRFCQMMGGDITVQSEQGMGTTFHAWLPTFVSEPKAVPPLRPAPPKVAGSKTVLVIDDDPVVQDLLSRILNKEGFHAVCALSGEEGLRRAAEVKPDVITVDVMMPVMDGWTVLSRLKDDPALAEIPVIMLTMVDNETLGYALGAADYLTKPIDRNRLVSVLRKFTQDDKPRSVMVVDDDEAIREMLRRSLEKEGWTVREAQNGKHAIHVLETFRPGLILLDLMMPEMDGFQFVEEIQKQEPLRSIPIVVVTAKDFTNEDRNRLNGSVRAVMQKGHCSIEDVLSRIRSLSQ